DSVVCGLESGADDYLQKPFRSAELLVRIRAGERLLNLESRELTIFALARLVESRDNETGGHLERMREYARIIAEDLALQPEFESVIDGQYINLLYLTTPLHDIGKVGIPDSILRKAGQLTPDEWDVMKTHTLIGARTLDEVTAMHHNATYLAMARDIALTHHEHFDGGGYPHGLAGEDIPLCGRITAMADVYDALTSQRAYKQAFTHEEARLIIEQQRGRQFDPRIVDAFLRCQDRLQEAWRRLKDGVSLQTSRDAKPHPISQKPARKKLPQLDAAPAAPASGDAVLV
ncbi:MAG: HD domain-containing protein, partial [Planctomycetaceae bacterium]|nr:HD domain-containing protein [Planctomycetaceae bacterium]